METMRNKPPAGLARLLFDLTSSGWLAVVAESAREEIAAYKMFLVRSGASGEISVGEINDLLKELEGIRQKAVDIAVMKLQSGS